MTHTSAPHILIIDALAAEGVRGLQERFGEAQVQYLPQLAPAEVPAALAEAHVLVLRNKLAVEERLLQAAPNLQLVMRAGAGTDHIDDAALGRRGIALRTARGENARTVGEHTLGMLLALLHKLPAANASVRRGEWEREAHRGRELGELTVGIIGFGHTGAAFGDTLRGFGCRVLAYDKYRCSYGIDHVKQVGLAPVVQAADVFSFHVPLTRHTRHYYNDAFRKQVGRPHWLLNLSRGEVVDLQAVRHGLEEGQLLGAALDVLPAEPPHKMPPAERETYEWLLQRPEVLFSPHVGGWSYASERRIALRCVAEIERWWKAKQP